MLFFVETHHSSWRQVHKRIVDDKVNISLTWLVRRRHSHRRFQNSRARKSQEIHTRRHLYYHIHLLYTHFHRKMLLTEIDKEKKKAAAQAFQMRIMHFCKSIIDRFSEKSSIGFSAIRILARRLKQPLSKTIKDLECLEAVELGLRYENEDCGDEIIFDEKYCDWAPQTDRTVANALDSGNENLAGSRCSYVGFEDSDSDEINTSSLNVEQLAMELYRTGRMPPETSDTSCKGGWRGFHDEGKKSSLNLFLSVRNISLMQSL